MATTRLPILARNFLSHQLLKGARRRTDSWARCLQSSTQLDGNHFTKKHYSTGLSYPDNIDLHSKLVEMEQKLESAVSREDFSKLEQDIQNQLSSLRESFKEFGDEIVKIQEKLSGLSVNRTDSSEHMIDAVVEELMEREKRRSYVLVSNLPEDESSVSEQSHDLTVVNDLFLKRLQLDVDIVQVRRLGQRNDNRGRRLIIEFGSEGDKLKAVRSFRKMGGFKDTIWGAARFGPFLTRTQRETLHKQVDTKNEEAESLGLGSPWYIDLTGEIKNRNSRFL